MKLFTFTALVSLILLVSKIGGLLDISYLQVFAPIIGSFIVSLFFFIIAVIVAVAAKGR